MSPENIHRQLLIIFNSKFEMIYCIRSWLKVKFIYLPFDLRQNFLLFYYKLYKINAAIIGVWKYES